CGADIPQSAGSRASGPRCVPTAVRAASHRQGGLVQRRPVMPLVTKTGRVFGMSPQPRRAVYVDRAKLDQKTKDALHSGKIVAVHGDSKQGKSWLVHAVISKRRAARVQCLGEQSAQDVLEAALANIGISIEVEDEESGQVTARVISVGHKTRRQ